MREARRRFVREGPGWDSCGLSYRNGTRYDEVYPKYELIGTHTGRKTFICFALSNGVPPDVVMKFTGHCDYKSMKPYIDIVTRTKSDAMAKIAASLEEVE